MAAGRFHTVLLRSDGAAVGFGNSAGGTCDIPIPDPPPGTQFVGATTFLRGALLICDSGDVVLCSKGGAAPSIPRPPPGVRYVDAGANEGHAALVRSDGEAICVGNNFWHQCAVPGTPPGVKYVAAATGGCHTALLRSDGQVVAFGQRDGGQCDIPELPEGLSYTRVSAGGCLTVLLRSDGRAVACGSMEFDMPEVPELPTGMYYVEAVSGGNHVVLLRSDGEALAIGSNDAGQCNVPSLPPGIRYVHAAAGHRHTVLLRSDGHAVAFGWNVHGQCDVPALPAGLSYVRPSAGTATAMCPTLSALGELVQLADEVAAEVPTEGRGSNGSGPTPDESTLTQDESDLATLLSSILAEAESTIRPDEGGFRDAKAPELGTRRGRSKGRSPKSPATVPRYAEPTMSSLQYTENSLWAEQLEDVKLRARQTLDAAILRPAEDPPKVRPHSASSRRSPKKSAGTHDRFFLRSSDIYAPSVGGPCATLSVASDDLDTTVPMSDGTAPRKDRTSSTESDTRSSAHDSFARARSRPTSTRARSAPPEARPLFEQYPHDQLREYGGFIADLKDILRPNLAKGCTILPSSEPEKLPHDHLQEYDGLIHDVRTILRPGLRQGQTAMYSSVPDAMPHDQLQEYGGFVSDLSDITRPDLKYGGSFASARRPASPRRKAYMPKEHTADVAESGVADSGVVPGPAPWDTWGATCACYRRPHAAIAEEPEEEHQPRFVKVCSAGPTPKHTDAFTPDLGETGGTAEGYAEEQGCGEEDASAPQPKTVPHSLNPVGMVRAIRAGRRAPSLM